MATLEQPQTSTDLLRFPANFVWGTATASFQIEGAADLRSESIWDRFCATPGKVANGDTGLVACDHYHLWSQDIALMQQLGTNAYRFSISWPRVIPAGTGEVNQAGLDFYDRLVDGLLEAGIQPYATLYHWDLPQVLEDKGGWANRETALAFAEYVEVVVRRLGDRVKGWITLNEPWCSAYLGYMDGEHAPGHQNADLYHRAVHHLLLAHGLAVPVIRQFAPQAEVGITLNFNPSYPADPSSEADRLAAQKADASFDRLYADPIFKGRYPALFLESIGGEQALPIQEGDYKIISTPIDFLGVNFYNRKVVQATPEGWRGVQTDSVYTTMNWEVYAPAFYNLLNWLHQEYAPKRLYITENGSSGEEGPDATGQVQDTLRGYYLQEHLAQLHRAISEGVPVAGYFAWSLMDNFEWAYGYSRRFGLVYVDFETQQRIIKASGQWYGRVVRQNALPLHEWSL